VRKILTIAVIVVIAVFAVVGGGWLALQRADVPYAELEQRYGSERSKFIETPDGLQIHYTDEGVSSGRTLVLVHGYTASFRTWDAWVERLAERDRIVRIDLPGHGLTQAPEDYAYKNGDFTRAIDAVADALHLDRFVLVGSSMGGEAAWTYALERPERVEALTLVGSAGWPLAESPNIAKTKEMLRSPLAPALRNLDNSAFFEAVVPMFYGDPAFATEEKIAQYIAMSRAPGHRKIIGDILLAFDNGRATPEAMGTIEAPTLVLHGEADKIVPVDHGRRFAQTIPGAQLVTYPGVGHLAHEEAPEKTAADLTAFLDRALAPPTAMGAPLGAALRR
jgi:pimeloyl-ACP methyl ester carboxylesterase